VEIAFSMRLGLSALEAARRPGTSQTFVREQLDALAEELEG